MPSRPVWSDTSAVLAAVSSKDIIAVLSREYQSEAEIAKQAKAKPLHAYHILRDFCSRGLARRKRYSTGPDKFVITDRGVAYRDRLQEKQKKQQQK